MRGLADISLPSPRFIAPALLCFILTLAMFTPLPVSVSWPPSPGRNVDARHPRGARRQRDDDAAPPRDHRQRGPRPQIPVHVPAPRSRGIEPAMNSHYLAPYQGHYLAFYLAHYLASTGVPPCHPLLPSTLFLTSTSNPRGAGTCTGSGAHTRGRCGLGHHRRRDAHDHLHGDDHRALHHLRHGAPEPYLALCSLPRLSITSMEMIIERSITFATVRPSPT